MVDDDVAGAGVRRCRIDQCGAGRPNVVEPPSTEDERSSRNDRAAGPARAAVAADFEVAAANLIQRVAVAAVGDDAGKHQRTIDLQPGMVCERRRSVKTGNESAAVGDPKELHVKREVVEGQQLVAAAPGCASRCKDRVGVLVDDVIADMDALLITGTIADCEGRERSAAK